MKEESVVKQGLNMKEDVMSDVQNRRKTNPKNQVQQVKKTTAKANDGSKVVFV